MKKAFPFLILGLLAGAAAGGAAVWLWLRQEERSTATVAPQSGAPVASDDPYFVPFPDVEELARIGKRALRDSRYDGEFGYVEVIDELPDGSRAVRVVLKDGRSMDGRLYLEKMKYRISVDFRSIRKNDNNPVVIIVK